MKRTPPPSPMFHLKGDSFSCTQAPAPTGSDFKDGRPLFWTVLIEPLDLGDTWLGIDWVASVWSYYSWRTSGKLPEERVAIWLSVGEHRRGPSRQHDIKRRALFTLYIRCWPWLYASGTYSRWRDRLSYHNVWDNRPSPQVHGAYVPSYLHMYVWSGDCAVHAVTI